MTNPNLPYRMVAVAPNATFTRNVQNAPTPAQIATFAEIRSAHFVVRYYPSKKGWMVTDVRQRREINLRQGRTVWDTRSLVRHPKVFPSEDAAVMWAMHHTGTEVVQ